ncbi:TadE/TadG family type IV pilus assembly protein [Yoonia sp. I 8.24]|uniref:TadE/TadG family type IV pilus assembly protein n=1 Tax=Yoonia sp. I 8.24 TaxID=1537229 RepID=UPI001EE014B2|nr:hypothetical protein [Yoonia sp. I 8.24]MCG3268876.1 hypothetical protein [Yoonia sp. I 8.24]
MKIKSLLQDFRDDESGVIAIELLLVVPILVWALLSTLVYFDAFKTESISTRMSMTIADMFSREVEVDNTFINGAHDLLEALTPSADAPDMRITVYTFDESDDQYDRVWSRNRGSYYSNHTNATLRAESDRLPILSDGDNAILVETHTEYSAPFSIGIGPFLETNLDDLSFDTFTVIRPRDGNVCFIQNNGGSVCSN